MSMYFTWGASLFTDPTTPLDAAARDRGLAARMPAFPAYLLPSLEWVPFRRRAGAARSPDGPSSATGSPSSSSSKSSSSSPVTSITTASSSRRASPERPASDELAAHQGIIATNGAGGEKDNDYNHSSSSSSSSSSSRQQTARNGRRRRLARGAPDTLKCRGCSADIAFASQIISKGFTGHHGRAYLVSPRGGGAPALDGPDTGGASLANVGAGLEESRQLVTGWHTVADVSCAVCGRKVGWKYVDAREPAQRYKIGKFILEAEQVVRHQTWVDVWDDEEEEEAKEEEGEPGGRAGGWGGRGGGGGGDKGKGRAGQGGGGEDEDEVEFDSDNSDECWEIFTATWDARKVAARRRMKAGNGARPG